MNSIPGDKGRGIARDIQYSHFYFQHYKKMITKSELFPGPFSTFKLCKLCNFLLKPHRTTPPPLLKVCKKFCTLLRPPPASNYAKIQGVPEGPRPVKLYTTPPIYPYSRSPSSQAWVQRTKLAFGQKAT